MISIVCGVRSGSTLRQWEQGRNQENIREHDCPDLSDVLYSHAFMAFVVCNSIM